MHRKGHIIGGAVSWGVVIALFYLLETLATTEDLINSALWIILSFFTSQFGAQLPDYDILWKKLLPHRNIVTHSAFIPALLVIPLYFVNTISEIIPLVPLIATYLFGHATHLFLDWLPESWQGSALVHVVWRNTKGRKTFPKFASFMFLLINGLIILAAGIIFMFFYAAWI